MVHEEYELYTIDDNEEEYDLSDEEHVKDENESQEEDLGNNDVSQEEPPEEGSCEKDIPKEEILFDTEPVETSTLSDDSPTSTFRDSLISSPQRRLSLVTSQEPPRKDSLNDVKNYIDYGLSESESEFELSPMASSQILLPMKRGKSFPQTTPSKKHKVNSSFVNIITTSRHTSDSS